MTLNQTLPRDKQGIRISLQDLDCQIDLLDQPPSGDDQRDRKQTQRAYSNPDDVGKSRSRRWATIRDRLHCYLPSLWGNLNKSPQSQADPSPDCPLLVIGAGQMRTGTTSLKQALEILYQKPCYHMSRVVYELKQPHIRKWIQAFRRLDQLKPGQDFQSVLPRTFWNSIFDGFVAAVDYPTSAFYKDLLNVYPQAKIILTVRDPDSWVSSCRATTASDLVMHKTNPFEFLINSVRGIRGLPELHHRMFERALGQGYATYSDQKLRQKFVEWNEQVMRSVPSERLLVYDVTQGWEPLCKFLDLPFPDPGIKFPHLNKRQDMIRVLVKYRQMERILKVVLVFVVFSAVFMLFYYLYIFH